jgi:hypothetical protein
VIHYYGLILGYKILGGCIHKTYLLLYSHYCTHIRDGDVDMSDECTSIQHNVQYFELNIQLYTTLTLRDLRVCMLSRTARRSRVFVLMRLVLGGMAWARSG